MWVDILHKVELHEQSSLGIEVKATDSPSRVIDERVDLLWIIELLHQNRLGQVVDQWLQLLRIAGQHEVKVKAEHFDL